MNSQIEVGTTPLGWRIAKIKEIGPVKMCRRIFNYQTTKVGDIPFYKIGTFGKEPDAFISRILYQNYRQKYPYPRKGDTLISAAGTIGRTFIYNGEDAYFQDSNIVWVENKSRIVSDEFLYYVYKTIKYKTEGGTIQRLYNSILLNASFPLPPLEEQKAIAQVLSDFDNLIVGLERLIAKKRSIKEGVLQELLRPKAGWIKTTLGEIAQIRGGGTPSTGREEYWNGRFNWFTPTEVGKEKYLRSSQRKLTELGLKNSSASLLPAGTVLLTSRAGIGDLGILMEPSATNQGFQSLLPNDGVDVEFLYYLLGTKKKELHQFASGSTFLEISPAKIKSIDIQIPSLIEQGNIAALLCQLDEEILKLEQKLNKYRHLKEGVMSQLLTGKTRLV